MENNKVMGRPIIWPETNVPISKRLQDILPKIGMAQLGEIFFNGMSTTGVKSILAGTSEPPPSALITIAEKCGCDLVWLITGNKKGENEIAPTEAGARKDITELFSILTVTHKTLTILAEDVTGGRLPCDRARMAVEAALIELLKAHGTLETVGIQQKTG